MNLTSVALLLTTDCNFRCSFCSGENLRCRRIPGNLPGPEKLAKVAGELKASKVQRAVITGGEPLLERRRLLELCGLLVNNGVQVEINSNLSLMTAELAKEIRSLIGSTLILSSLHSFDPGACDRITNTGGSFEAILNGIKACIDNGLEVGVNMSISKRNMSELDFRIVSDFITRTGITYLSILRVIPSSKDRSLPEYQLTSGDLFRVGELLDQVRRRFGIVVGTVVPIPLCRVDRFAHFPHVRGGRCTAGIDRCAIDLTTGQVFLCPYEERTCGDIYTNSLDGIWTAVRREMPKYALLANACLDCELLEKCGGICRWNLIPQC